MNTARASLSGLIGLLLVVPVAPGCGGVTGPATLSRSERTAVESVRLDLRLGVQGRRWVQRTEKGRIVYGDEDEWQRDNFIATMRERKLFREVAPLEALYPDVDLVATVSRTVVDADNPLPFWTFLTLGVFPTVANATERYVVTFAPPDAKPTVRVEAEHRGKIVIGWAGGLLAVFAPGWMFPGTYTRRMHEQLELAIARKADAILALAGR
jgi:hypothetical protein